MKIEPMEIEQYYFPVNLSQVKWLVGKMLTHVEAMNLSDKAEKANKDLINQSIWRWWDEAQENSMTSWKGCIGPIRSSSVTSDSHVWYTDIGRVEPTSKASEQWRKSTSLTEASN